MSRVMKNVWTVCCVAVLVAGGLLLSGKGLTAEDKKEEKKAPAAAEGKKEAASEDKNASPAKTDTEIEVKENVEYGTGGDEKLTLHLARPKTGENLPVVLVIHGGGWAGGNKDSHKKEAMDFAKRGYVSASIGYRLAPKHKFPAAVEDVKCEVRWFRAHAADLKINPDKIGAIGFSAGAHLVMMLGTMDKEDGLEGDGGWSEHSSKVSAVVSYAGPTNLLGEYPPISQEIVKKFIGGTKEEMKEAYRLASPITYVDKRDATMLLYQGTNDILVPYPQAFEMAQALTKVGLTGRVELMLNAGHGCGGSPDLDRTLNDMHRFMDWKLKGNAEAAKGTR